MPAAPDNLQFAEIVDFTPGIHSENTSTLPAGAAHPDGTFGCFALPDGPLAAFPRATVFTPPADLISSVTGNQVEEIRITGLQTVGPIALGGSGTIGADENHTGVVVACEWWSGPVGPDYTRHSSLWIYHRDFTVPVWDELTNHDRVHVFSPVSLTTTDIYPTRSNHAIVARAGPSVLAVCESGPSPIYEFPKDETPDVQVAQWLPSDNVDDPTMAAALIDPAFGASAIVVHQGRLVTFMRLVTAFGDNSFYDTDEQFFWSVVNDIQTPAPQFAAGGWDYFRVHVGWEHPTGYGVMESLTSDELLLIKKSGGAWLLRGSLDNFQAVNYPFVRSTGESFNRGARSTKGFVYPVDGGSAWMWTGGQTSVEIAAQLDSGFWNVPTTPASGDQAGQDVDIWRYYTSCSTVDVFTFFPNNYVWDSSIGDLGAWWRTDDPTDLIIHRWASDWRGVAVYGTPSGFTETTDPAVYEYDFTIPARASYSWLSHPVLPDHGEVSVREIIVAASGTGTITITAFTAENSTGQSVSFDITGTANYPTIGRAVCSITGTHIQFQVTSTATDPDDEAPHLHRIRWGFVDQNLSPSQ